MTGNYVEKREGGYWITGTRISLDSIVYAFLSGQTAESIVQSFDQLSLEQVYGAVTFYLRKREVIDNYLQKTKNDFEKTRNKSRDKEPSFYAKLDKVRRHKEIVDQ